MRKRKPSDDARSVAKGLRQAAGTLGDARANESTMEEAANWTRIAHTLEEMGQ